MDTGRGGAVPLSPCRAGRRPFLMAITTPKPIKQRIPGPFAGTERVCSEPDCITRLCQYDPGPRCYACEQKQSDREREVEIAEFMAEAA